jgi:hypothetical protein
MKGLIPPVILNRFLQRQPLAVHYLRETLMDMARTRRLPCVSRTKFSLRSTRVSSDYDTPVDEEDSTDRGSLSPVEFSTNALGSTLFTGNSSKLYEDPVGISEFIGHNTTPRTKKRQRRRHWCCHDQDSAEGTGRETLFSSGSCEECRKRANPNFPAAGSNGMSRNNNNYITR